VPVARVTNIKSVWAVVTLGINIPLFVVFTSIIAALLEDTGTLCPKAVKQAKNKMLRVINVFIIGVFYFFMQPKAFVGANFKSLTDASKRNQ